MFSKLSYWYGLQFSEIAQMPFVTINTYLEKIEARKTETKLMLADVILLPNMKNKDRAGLINNWMKYLDIQKQIETKPASPSILKMMGIGVKHV